MKWLIWEGKINNEGAEKNLKIGKGKEENCISVSASFYRQLPVYTSLFLSNVIHLDIYPLSFCLCLPFLASVFFLLPLALCAEDMTVL